MNNWCPVQDMVDGTIYPAFGNFLNCILEQCDFCSASPEGLRVYCEFRHGTNWTQCVAAFQFLMNRLWCMWFRQASWCPLQLRYSENILRIRRIYPWRIKFITTNFQGLYAGFFALYRFAIVQLSMKKGHSDWKEANPQW